MGYIFSSVDPNFHFEEMPSDGESDDDIGSYIMDEDVEDEAELPPSPLAKSKLLALALVQLVLVRYFLALVSLQVTTLYYTYIIFLNK